MFSDKKFLLCFLFFIFLNVLFYFATAYFSTSVPFQTAFYHGNSNHYFTDPRFSGGKFDLVRAMGGWDAQWYLKIAGSGYKTTQGIDALPYAFFPLYPIILRIFNILSPDLELTAFVLSNIFLVVNFISLYYVISKLASKPIALRASFLFYLFPFSAFFRYYYAEELFLFLLIWFSYFLIKRRWFVTTFFLALLMVTKPHGLLLVPLYLVYILHDIKKNKLSKAKGIVSIVTIFIPFAAWTSFCYIKTGDPLYWSTVQSLWYQPRSPIYLLIHNLVTVLSFFRLPFHTWHASKVDAFFVFLTIFLLYKSKKYLRRELWLMSCLLCISPLILKDTMSYSRYIIVAFPLFIYVASVVKGRIFLLLSSVLFILLIVTSVFFVNWYWVA